jgi:hypothetical protein
VSAEDWRRFGEAGGFDQFRRRELPLDAHQWARDPERRGEGLACTACGVTEEEAGQYGGLSTCYSRPGEAEQAGGGTAPGRVPRARPAAGSPPGVTEEAT